MRLVFKDRVGGRPIEWVSVEKVDGSENEMSGGEYVGNLLRSMGWWMGKQVKCPLEGA